MISKRQLLTEDADISANTSSSDLLFQYFIFHKIMYIFQNVTRPNKNIIAIYS